MDHGTQLRADPAEAGLRTEDDGISLFQLAGILFARWRLLVALPLTAGVTAIAISFLIAPTFTAKTVFLPPQQPQSATASALASLGALSALGGGALGNVRTTADQYVSLMQSANVQDRLIDRFKLLETYEAKFRFQARQALSQNTRITLGKKDGLITIEVDAHSPQLAADLANGHVAELRRLTGELALTEAQQRRVFFESELKRTRDQLAKAQQALQQSGFNPGALKAEPRAAAENYARLKAETTAAEVLLQTMRARLADSATEVQQQRALVRALRAQLEELERSEVQPATQPDSGYIGRFREFRYQESLFELFSRQFEAARLDESREGGLIQVVDAATPPEHKSRPKRANIAVTTTLVAFMLLTLAILGQHFWSRSRRSFAPNPD